MGLIICLLFGVMISWVTVTAIPKWRPGNMLYSVAIGLIAGFTGCWAGKQLGFADFDMLNLYSLGIAIGTAVVLNGFSYMVNLFGWQSNITRAGIVVLDDHEKALAEHK